METFGLELVIKEIHKINEGLEKIKNNLEKQSQIDYCACVKKAQKLDEIAKELSLV